MIYPLIKTAAASMLFCLLIVCVAWNLALLSATSVMGVSVVGVGSFIAYMAGTAAAAGAIAEVISKKFGS